MGWPPPDPRAVAMVKGQAGSGRGRRATIGPPRAGPSAPRRCVNGRDGPHPRRDAHGGQHVGAARKRRGRRRYLKSCHERSGQRVILELLPPDRRLALDDFEHNVASFDARASAVAAVAGAGSAINYQPGVIVYVKPRVGLMAQAAIGGQQFQYYPLP